MILKTNSEVGTPKCIQFPEGWIVKPLQELTHCSFGGGTPSTTNPCFWNGPIPWITTAIINSEDVFLKRFQRGITQKALDCTSTQLAPKGSVLIGTRVGVGKVAVTTFDVAINQDLTAFVLKENVDAEFLAYCMKQQAVQSWFEENKRGTTIKGVARNTILNLMIPLPSFPEQRAIARALRAVQGAREARLREVALERERKAALMEHLFTKGTRGEATKQTEIGEMPESWKIERINACCAKSNLKNPKDNPDKSFSYVDVSSVSNESYRIIETKKILGRDAPSRARKHIKKDDVIFATVRPTLKRIALVPCDLDGQICSTGFCVLRANRENLNPLYLYYYLLTEQIAKKVDILQKGATYPAISDSELLNQVAPIPSINEQAQIAGILRACDSKIAALEHEARLLQELFRAMLEELMSGRLPAGALVEDAA